MVYRKPFIIFSASQGSENSKEEFLKQLEKIIQGVKATEDKIQKKLKQEKDKRYACNETLMELVEKQREYYKTVRDFQEVPLFFILWWNKDIVGLMSAEIILRL